MPLKLSPEERAAIMGVIEEKQKAIGVGMEARRQEDMLTYEQHMAELGDIRGEVRKEERDIRKFEREKVTLDPLTPEEAKEMGLVATGYDPETGLTKWGRERVGRRVTGRVETTRSKIMSLRDEAKILTGELKTLMGDLTRPDFEYEATRKYEADEMGSQKLAIKNYRFLIDSEKRIKEIKEQIRKLNKGLPADQQIDIDEVLAETTIFNSIEEAEAANLPVGTEVIIQGRRAIIE